MEQINIDKTVFYVDDFFMGLFTGKHGVNKLEIASQSDTPLRELKERLEEKGFTHRYAYCCDLVTRYNLDSKETYILDICIDARY